MSAVGAGWTGCWPVGGVAAAQTCCFHTRILSDHRVDLIEGNYTWLWKIFFTVFRSSVQ